jgi:hypothetical protein
MNKEITMTSLRRSLHEIEACYSIIYDRAYSEKQTRDDLFMKELVDILLPIEALVYVYARDGEIHPDYVLEKLTLAKNMIATQISYWEARKE